MLSISFTPLVIILNYEKCAEPCEITGYDLLQPGYNIANCGSNHPGGRRTKPGKSLSTSKTLKATWKKIPFQALSHLILLNSEHISAYIREGENCWTRGFLKPLAGVYDIIAPDSSSANRLWPRGFDKTRPGPAKKKQGRGVTMSYGCNLSLGRRGFTWVVGDCKPG